MDKQDLFATFIIGEVCALIFLAISGFLELPKVFTQLALFFPALLPILSVLGLFLVSLSEKKMPTLFQMAKSFLVGILNTFIDLGLLNLLMWSFQITSGWIYSLFKAFSFSVAIINSYFWNKSWTFSTAFEAPTKEDGIFKTKEFIKFISIALVGLVIHIITSSVVVNVIKPQFGLNAKLWANVGAIAAAFAGFLWNFFGYKLLVFKK